MQDGRNDIPTLTPQNEWVSRVQELDELYTKLQIVTGFTAEQLLEMFAAGYTLKKPDYSKHFEAMANLAESDPPNEPLTLEQLLEMDEIPIYVVTEKYGSGWCVLNWHGVKKAYTYFSRTGTSEGMTATPLSAKTYGDLWIAYRRPPEGEVDA